MAHQHQAGPMKLDRLAIIDACILRLERMRRDERVRRFRRRYRMPAGPVPRIPPFPE